MPDPSESLRLTADDIGNTLGNPVTLLNGNTFVLRPYKLVILFACTAYSSDFAKAFGIADFMPPRAAATGPITEHGPYPWDIEGYVAQGRSTQTVQSYLYDGKIPQAYIGWPCNINRPTTTDKVDTEMQNLVNTLYAWQDDTVDPSYTVSQCMNILASLEAASLTYNPDKDGIIGVFKWELSGCYDLRITDRNP